jgi:hypothetical protein
VMISFLGPFGMGSMGGSHMSVLGAGPPLPDFHPHMR